MRVLLKDKLIVVKDDKVYKFDLHSQYIFREKFREFREKYITIETAVITYR